MTLQNAHLEFNINSKFSKRPVNVCKEKHAQFNLHQIGKTGLGSNESPKGKQPSELKEEEDHTQVPTIAGQRSAKFPKYNYNILQHLLVHSIKAIKYFSN